MYEYKALITKVVDGDTFDCDVDLGMYVHYKARIRLLDVDAYEKYGSTKELGIKIRDYITPLLLNKEVIIKSHKPDSSLYTDSFGRWLAEVKFGDSLDTDLAQFLLEHNFTKDSKGTPIFD